MLQVKKMSKSFGGITAVDGCSFEVLEGSITGLIGPNGAGKTTMFNLISGFLKPDSGQVLFKNNDITNLKPYRRAVLGMGRSFQAIRIFPELSVLDNIILAFGDNPRRFRDVWRSRKKVDAKLRKRASDILEKVQLMDVMDCYAAQLSYGQQKLLEIGRMVAMDAELMMLDEPASGINPTLLNKMSDLIRRLNKDGKTILLVEHNMPFVMELCDRVVVMDYGKEIAVGAPEEIQGDERVLEAYLGRCGDTARPPGGHRPD